MLLDLSCPAVHSRGVLVGRLSGGGHFSAVMGPGAWPGSCGGGQAVGFFSIVIVLCTACSMQYNSCNLIQGNRDPLMQGSLLG